VAPLLEQFPSRLGELGPVPAPVEEQDVERLLHLLHE